MRCPYCEGKMRKGQLHAVGAGAGLEWKEGSESLRLNTDPELAARISGDRIAAYNCDFCRKLLSLIKSMNRRSGERTSTSFSK